MDFSELSLDDIIKKGKVGSTDFRKKRFPSKKGTKNIATGGATKKFSITKKPVSKPIIDARNKIIQKNRAKIHDARDKLVQIAKRSGDVRMKLLKKSIDSKKSRNLAPLLKRNAGNAGLVRSDDRAKGLIKNADLDSVMDIMPPISSLRRTVKNDLNLYSSGSAMPPLPTFKYMEQTRRITANNRPEMDTAHTWESDPFDCYEVPVARPYDVSEPRNLNRSVRTAHMDEIPRKGILRTNAGSNGNLHNYERSPPEIPSYTSKRKLYVDDASVLSRTMQVRLQRAPDINQSAGIFSNPYTSSTKEPHPPANAGYRIVVSNLHSSVSQSDIKELFEDIGPLIEVRLVRTGVAEVIFEKLRDAENAVDTYHNRQLDGQPMKCLLVNPRASNKPTAPAMKPARSNLSKSSKVEIDIDALHSVLFRRS